MAVMACEIFQDFKFAFTSILALWRLRAPLAYPAYWNCRRHRTLFPLHSHTDIANPLRAPRYPADKTRKSDVISSGFMGPSEPLNLAEAVRSSSLTADADTSSTNASCSTTLQQ